MSNDFDHDETGSSYYCSLLKKEIGYAECYEINMENFRAVIPENIKLIRRHKEISFADILATCKVCANQPFKENL